MSDEARRIAANIASCRSCSRVRQGVMRLVTKITALSATYCFVYSFTVATDGAY
jgi:hypothetical protein